MQKLNNTLRDKQGVKEDKREIRRYLDKNRKGHTTFQNLQDATYALLSEKIILIKIYSKGKERYQVNYIMLHLKELEKD